MSFSSAWSTNATSICASCGLGKVARMERSRRFKLHSSQPLTDAQRTAFAGLVRAQQLGRAHGTCRINTSSPTRYMTA